jgi:hypothetical protein
MGRGDWEVVPGGSVGDWQMDTRTEKCQHNGVTVGELATYFKARVEENIEINGIRGRPGMGNVAADH